ncbi:hypothetical protein ECG_02982 [Echinococcus granulosus]|nr:hypothetical protein ECG_02982 [Echinococcus granulosus]
MVVLRGSSFSHDLVRGLRMLSMRSVRSKRNAKPDASRGVTNNELRMDHEMFDAVEHLSDTLINDTSRSVAASITKEHQRARENIKARIIFRKNFRGPPELTILTYRAREQIAHLSMTQPSEWGAEAVSEYFPISCCGAALLLQKQRKNPHRFFRSLDFVVNHDTQSIKNWLTLIEVICTAQVEDQVKANESQTLQILSTRLPSGLRWIGVANVLNKLAFADGNPALPYPPQTSIEAFSFIKSRHQPGYFQQIAERFCKPIDTTNESICVREQQLSVINKLISLFRCMDFSVFTQPLLEDSALTFKTVCRNWLYIDSNSPQLAQSRLPKTKSKVDCDFTKSIRYKRVFGSLNEESILSSTEGGGYRHSALENTIPGLSLQISPSMDRCLSVLPPIDTFSHQEVEPRFNRQEESKRGLKVKSRRNRTSGGIQKQAKPLSISKNGTTLDKHGFPCPIPSCVRASPETAFKRRYLMQEHLNFHRRQKPFCCDRCPQRFTSRQNLARHRLIHAGVTYTCSECRHVFMRSSDRSKCLRNHRLQRIISEQGTNARPAPAVVVPKNASISFPTTINGPYVCPLCPDQRGYKLDSSLRKHMRLHHPNYKRTMGIQVSRVDEIPSKVATQQVGDPRRPPSETAVVNYSLKTPAIAVASDPTASQLPISLGSGTGAYLLSTGDIFYAVVPQYTGIDQPIPAVGPAGVEGTTEQRPTILMELAPAGSGVVGEEPRRSVHSAVLGVTEGPLIFTHCLPVDLCTSALCLTVTDPSLPTSLSPTSQHPAVIPVQTRVCSSIAGEGALDLTELPHEVIDLSHSNPVDLSSAHPHASRSTLWEPEPGFSFTDLLNVDDEDPRGLLLGSEFEVGLDLRLPEPL